MTNSIRKEILLPHPPSQVWQAIATSSALAEWLHPNDFQPRVGHRFTFRVPPNPQANFDGLIVHCEVLHCEPPTKLVFSWSVGGPIVDTHVSFLLKPDGPNTRLLFEHSGFDLSKPWAEPAFHGAEYGWSMMLEQLLPVAARIPPSPTTSN